MPHSRKLRTRSFFFPRIHLAFSAHITTTHGYIRSDEQKAPNYLDHGRIGAVIEAAIVISDGELDRVDFGVIDFDCGNTESGRTKGGARGEDCGKGRNTGHRRRKGGICGCDNGTTNEEALEGGLGEIGSGRGEAEGERQKGGNRVKQKMRKGDWCGGWILLLNFWE